VGPRASPNGIAGEAIPDLDGVKLRKAEMIDADLRSVNFGGADLEKADLGGAKLAKANLTQAKLGAPDLSGADLKWAKLTKADLGGADFTEAKLTGTVFSGALCSQTIFAATDLSKAKGLESVRHFMESTLGMDTLIRSRGKISEKFLLECGLPKAWISNLPALIGALEPIQFYSCFISHSFHDKDFARHLKSRMHDEGLRVWLDEEHMKGGREMHRQIDEAIREHDKLLLVISEASMESTWVSTELRRARLAELHQGTRKLFPIRLVDFKPIKSWELPDDSGEDLAAEVRKFFIRLMTRRSST
jgi:uncharacterized protein YjbI with pentapeptide repeats